MYKAIAQTVGAETRCDDVRSNAIPRYAMTRLASRVAEAGIQARVAHDSVLHGAAPHRALEDVARLLEHAAGRAVLGERLGEDPQQPVSVEGPRGDERDGLGRDTATPVSTPSQ